MGGRYQGYPEYKMTGIEWLEQIPKDWELKPLKRVCRVDNSGSYGGEIGENEIDVPVATTAQIDKDGNFQVERMPVRSFSLNEMGRYVCKLGDILVVKSSGSAENIISGKAGYIDENTPEFIFSNFLLRLSPNKGEAVSKYLYYFVTSYLTVERIKKMVSTTTYPNLQVGSYISSNIPFPKIEEQKNISDFLDHETAKIDTLIEKQQQLIKLLKEKRQAVISHAVTKGLNPDAPMRDSGVEWLGEVPAHWEVTRLKYHITVFEQGWSPQCDSRPAENDEYGVLKVGCVNQGSFNAQENKKLPKELAPQLQYLLKESDLLISRANTRELVGSAAVVDRDYNNIMLCDKLYRLRFDELVNPHLIAYYLALPVVRQQIELEASGASHSMQNIGQSTIKEMPALFPPKVEADVLVSEVNKKVDVYGLMLNKAEAQIALLTERRTALISAAVTGKIDVRNWVAPEQQANKKDVA